jgi:hypothetical protein
MPAVARRDDNSRAKPSEAIVRFAQFAWHSGTTLDCATRDQRISPLARGTFSQIKRKRLQGALRATYRGVDVESRPVGHQRRERVELRETAEQWRR